MSLKIPVLEESNEINVRKIIRSKIKRLNDLKLENQKNVACSVFRPSVFEIRSFDFFIVEFLTL